MSLGHISKNIPLNINVKKSTIDCKDPFFITQYSGFQDNFNA